MGIPPPGAAVLLTFLSRLCPSCGKCLIIRTAAVVTGGPMPHWRKSSATKKVLCRPKKGLLDSAAPDAGRADAPTAEAAKAKAPTPIIKNTQAKKKRNTECSKVECVVDGSFCS